MSAAHDEDVLTYAGALVTPRVPTKPLLRVVAVDAASGDILRDHVFPLSD